MSDYVLTFGESMGVAVGAKALPFARSKDLHLGIGGAETNVAIGLARLGIDAVWASRLGVDSVGDLVRSDLQGERVRLAVHDERMAPTGFMLKERLPDGAANVTYYRQGSAASRLAPDDIPDHLIRGAALIHFSGIVLAISESARRLALSVVERAVAFDVPISFDLNFRPALWDRMSAKTAYGLIIPHCELVFAGVDEAAIVCGEGSIEAQASGLRALGARISVIKSGAAGAAALADDGFFARGPFAIDVVDTVGAGDAFAAGFIAAYLRGASTQGCLSYGSAAGALACRSHGDWEGAGTMGEVEALLASEVRAR